MNSHILLKYDQIDSSQTSDFLISIDSLRYHILHGGARAHCSDDYNLDGLSIKGDPFRHFELEFKSGSVTLYENKNGRNRYEKVDLDTLPKQTMIIGWKTVHNKVAKELS